MLLSIKDLYVHYGPVCALEGVNIEVNQGEIVAIIGHNGAGKTTLLKTISGLLRPSSGDIVYMGNSITKIPPEKIVTMGIAQTPEGRQVFPDLSVMDNLMAGAFTRDDATGIQDDIDRYFSIFPILKQRKNQKAGLLSGGEQQMLVIARSLMSNPKVLLLDEPSLGLAPVIVNEVYNIIKSIGQGNRTILLVEQNAIKALGIADRGYVLANGVVEKTGAGKDLIVDDDVRKAYLGA